jgi:hypothetical protein
MASSSGGKQYGSGAAFGGIRSFDPASLPLTLVWAPVEILGTYRNGAVATPKMLCNFAQ